AREVGGGISQFATTLYNASYFSGMKDAGHKEHSYYISRYPAGREATVFQNHDGSSVIDLKFTNDAPTGVVIQTIWTPSSITVRMWGTKRYGELRAAIDGVSEKMLTQTLRSLERDGLLTRTSHPTVPPKVEYGLTPLGRTLTGPLAAIRDWAEIHINEVTDARARYD
ncbi:winged helix-turn-helix transcriptional regulator, partial [Georgenia daeguensis]|uniref:winged helix-turn-helix transcriptional regulator n=1 Tax=Georgenia daeguensis TaxID=908355 RepID=UPI0031EC1EC7